jgi:hypothetical protein
LNWDPEKAKPADITSKWMFDFVYDDVRKALRVTQELGGSDPTYGEGEATTPGDRAGIMVGGIKPDDTFALAELTADGRIKVDTQISIQDVELEVNVDALDDSVAIGDAVTGDKMRVETDGSIYVNIKSSGLDDLDNILIAGTSDGTVGGTPNLGKIGSDKKLEVKDLDAQQKLDEIKEKTPARFVTEEFDDVVLSYVMAGPGLGQLFQAVYYDQGVEVARVECTYDSDEKLTRVRRV